MHIPGTEVQPAWWCFYMWWLFCLQSRQGAPTLNTIKFPPGSTSHSSHCCLQGAWTNIKGNRVILHSCQSITTSGDSPPMKSPAPLIPSAIFNDFPKTHSGFSGTVHHSGRVKWETRSLLLCLLVRALTPPLSLCLSPLFMMHMYLPWARGGWCESGGREPEQKITALCASVTVWLAAPHKILFTAHAEEKLQQQSSPEAGKSADLATLRERPGERGGVRHYNYYIASPYSQSVSILLR